MQKLEKYPMYPGFSYKIEQVVVSYPPSMSLPLFLKCAKDGLSFNL